MRTAAPSWKSTAGPARKAEAEPREPPTSSVVLKYHLKTRSWKPMQVEKTQGSRTLELFRAVTVLVFPTDTSKAKAMAKMCKPGRERGAEVRPRLCHPSSPLAYQAAVAGAKEPVPSPRTAR